MVGKTLLALRLTDEWFDRARTMTRKPGATRSLGWRALLSLVAVGATGLAVAHSEWSAGSPPPNAVLDEAPTQVVLTFTEPIETRFSVFKVYSLTADVTTGGGDVLASDEASRLDALAVALVDEVLTARGDEGERVDTGLVDTTDQADRVTLALEPDLPPGAYVVMWSVLAEDTHAMQGHYVIVVSTPDP